MDPFSALVAVWVVTLLFARAPEAIAEVGFALRGEMSPAHQARMDRLTEAGIDPATGGAFRQYAGNTWRDVWLREDEKRAARSAARGPYVFNPDAPTMTSRIRDWADGIRDRLDDATAAGVDRWRRRVVEESLPPVTMTAPVDPAQGGQATTGGAGPSSPITEPFVPSADLPPTHAAPIPESTPEPNREPIRVAATVGAPIPDRAPSAPTQRHAGGVAVLEGELIMSSGTVARSGAVTGVTSGAAEARAIQRAMDAANAEYVTALVRLRARLESLGAQTLANVQLAHRSRPVALLAQAAEAAAAAQGAAKSCGAEVGPLLGAAGRAFDALNS